MIEKYLSVHLFLQGYLMRGESDIKQHEVYVFQLHNKSSNLPGDGELLGTATFHLEAGKGRKLRVALGGWRVYLDSLVSRRSSGM